MSGILDLLNSNLGKNLVNSASKQLGQNKVQTASALTSALPLILGAMKNNASTRQVNNSNGIENLLGGLLGNGAQKEQSLVTQLLDADGDESVIDDLIGMASSKKKKGGLGSLLGGLFVGK